MIKSNMITFLSSLLLLSGAAAAQDREQLKILNVPTGISHDSNTIYFQSLERQDEGGLASQFFAMDANGENVRRVTGIGRGEAWPSFTRDGRRAVLHSDFGRGRAIHAEVVLVEMEAPGDLDDFVKVERLSLNPKEDWFASWSPDETQITFYSTRTGKPQVFVMDLATRDVRNISNNDAREQDPTWSSNGEITFQSDVTGNWDIWVANGDGSGRRNLTNHPGEDSFGAWSPDGEKLVFSSDRDGDHDLYIVNRNGSGLRRLTNGPAMEHWPRWSPDGSFISFEGRKDGIGDVYVIRPDGSGEKRLTNGESYHQ